MNNQVYGGVMLANLNISQWTARRTDKRAAANVSVTFGVAQEAHGTYYKSLVASDKLEALKKLTTQIRTYHYKVTLPWSDSGPRILPAAMFTEYVTEMNAYERQFNALVEEFLSEYPLTRSEAKRTLGQLFDDTDYPPTADIRTRFNMRVQYLPLPIGDDFRCQIGDNATEERIRREITAETDATIAKTVGELVDRIKAVIDGYLDGIGKTTSRGAFVVNARELVNLLPKLNVTNNANINALYESMRDTLVQFSADDMKHNVEAQEQARDAANKIKSDLMGWFK